MHVNRRQAMVPQAHRADTPKAAAPAAPERAHGWWGLCPGRRLSKPSRLRVGGHLEGAHRRRALLARGLFTSAIESPSMKRVQPITHPGAPSHRSDDHSLFPGKSNCYCHAIPDLKRRRCAGPMRATSWAAPWGRTSSAWTDFAEEVGGGLLLRAGRRCRGGFVHGGLLLSRLTTARQLGLCGGRNNRSIRNDLKRFVDVPSSDRRALRQLASRAAAMAQGIRQRAVATFGVVSRYRVRAGHGSKPVGTSSRGRRPVPHGAHRAFPAVRATSLRSQIGLDMVRRVAARGDLPRP